MATLKDEIMARSGPEDNLVAVKTDVNTSAYHTAGPDWAIIRDRRLAPAELHYKDEAEADRFFAQASTTGPAAQILRDVMTQRDVCAKQIYMHQVSGRVRRRCGVGCARRWSCRALAPRYVHLPERVAATGRTIVAHGVRFTVAAPPPPRTAARSCARRAGRRTRGSSARPRRSITTSAAQSCEFALGVAKLQLHCHPHRQPRARSGLSLVRRRAHTQLCALPQYTPLPTSLSPPPSCHCSARAVDVLCRKPFWDYHACVTANGKGSPACLQQWTAFDRCTEGF